MADLDRLPRLAVRTRKNDIRPAWSLRQVLELHDADSAGRIETDRGKSLDIACVDWSNTAITPVLQLNRRGQLKFYWVDANLDKLDKGVLVGVRAIQTRRCAKK